MAGVCIIGVGNTIRSDDGIGPYICSKIEDLHLQQVTTLEVHQLDAELVEDLLPYDHIMIVDAAVDGEDVDLYKLDAKDAVPLSTSHNVNAAMIAALAEQVYGKQLSTWICAVRGYEFQVGDNLSANALTNCHKAIDLVLEWTRSHAS